MANKNIIDILYWSLKYGRNFGSLIKVLRYMSDK